MSKKLIIGSRGSDLALWQANFFQAQLNSICVESEILVISTKGDRIQHLSFDKIEGKGFFTKEIEEALLAKEIDVAIHSHKDLETRIPVGLTIAGISYREDPADVLLIHPNAADITMPFGFKRNAVVGTSSARRKAQIKALRPDIELKDIRGNVPTRVEKLRLGAYDAILLANAGLSRLKLDLGDVIIHRLHPSVFIPAPAQGVLAYQCRSNDHEAQEIVRQLHHSDVSEIVGIERGILSQFGGGCQIPIGVFAEKADDGFDVRVNFSNAWENFPERVSFQVKNSIDALNQFKTLSPPTYPRSVLITRTLEQHSFLKRACSNKRIELFEQSLIQITPVQFSLDQAPDWIFFASSNAVQHFFAHVNTAIIKHCKFACIGEATAMTLASFVSKIEFIGTGDPISSAIALKNVVGSAQILCPGSAISNRTVQQQFDEDQCTDLVVYNTLPAQNIVIPKAECIIFSSPSNVDAFFKKMDKHSVDCAFIAIGKSTSNALNLLGISHRTANTPHEAELFNLLAR